MVIGVGGATGADGVEVVVLLGVLVVGAGVLGVVAVEVVVLLGVLVGAGVGVVGVVGVKAGCGIRGGVFIAFILPGTFPLFFQKVLSTGLIVEVVDILEYLRVVLSLGGWGRGPS